MKKRVVINRPGAPFSALWEIVFLSSWSSLIAGKDGQGDYGLRSHRSLRQRSLRRVSGLDPRKPIFLQKGDSTFLFLRCDQFGLMHSEGLGDPPVSTKIRPTRKGFWCVLEAGPEAFSPVEKVFRDYYQRSKKSLLSLLISYSPRYDD